MSEKRGQAVAQQLRDFGVRGVLITAAEQGRIVKLACAMEECYCPRELGGRAHFVEKTPDLPDWMPTADHYPVLKSKGGQRTVDNIRLAHRLCNRVDYSKQIGRSYASDVARVEASRRLARSVGRALDVRTVLVWNLALGSVPAKSPRKNGKRLRDLMAEYSVDVALLSEASVPAIGSDGALYEPRGTIGRDGKRRNWSTAIVSNHGCKEIHDAQAMSIRGRRPKVRFETSRPGSWIAGAVPVPGIGKVTCISMYGLMDELSDASMHRSLSEVSPLFSDPRYNELLLLGGDLNTSTQWKDDRLAATDRVLLDRIRTYGLVDCLLAKRKRGRLDDCTCTSKTCTHTWTRFDQSHPALQVDYLFASPALADRLKSCVALSPLEWREYSDHAPIIATFG